MNNILTYKGQFIDSRKCGEGIIKTSTGTYNGRFENDEFNGKGCFVWQNKKKAYIGNFERNKMHGNGKILYETGQVVEGKW